MNQKCNFFIPSALRSAHRSLRHPWNQLSLALLHGTRGGKISKKGQNWSMEFWKNNEGNRGGFKYAPSPLLLCNVLTRDSVLRREIWGHLFQLGFFFLWSDKWNEEIHHVFMAISFLLTCYEAAQDTASLAESLYCVSYIVMFLHEMIHCFITQQRFKLDVWSWTAKIWADIPVITFILILWLTFIVSYNTILASCPWGLV